MASEVTTQDRNLDFDTSVSGSEVTQTRQPATNAGMVENPSIPRANIAVTSTVPRGSTEYSEKFKDYVTFTKIPGSSSCADI